MNERGGQRTGARRAGLLSAPNVVAAVLVLTAVAAGAGALATREADRRTAAITVAGAVALVVIAVFGRVLGRWLAPLLTALTAAGALLVVHGILSGQTVFVAAGSVGLLTVGAGAAVIGQLADMARRAGLTDRSGTGTGLAELRSSELLSKIHENSMLSETAKRVLFRERELELLRETIERDTVAGDYHAALRLCDDMAEQFGYREEAETYRSRIENSRHEAYQGQVQAALDDLDSHLANRDWPRAHEVAGRIRRLYPDDHVHERVDTRINRAREDHRRELEEAFLEAATRDDIELAMERLRQLDRYLEREDASRLAEVANHVVAKHRENLGMQFKLAVNDHRWSDAARVGDTIIAEFPNTKMAEEVGSMIDVLRTRATQAAVAAEGEP